MREGRDERRGKRGIGRRWDREIDEKEGEVKKWENGGRRGRGENRGRREERGRKKVRRMYYPLILLILHYLSFISHLLWVSYHSWNVLSLICSPLRVKLF